VHKAIENSIGERRVADGLMPVLDGKLAGDERGAYLVAVLEKFKEVASALLGKGSGGEVIEHDEVSAGKLGEELAIAAIAFGDSELLEPAWGAHIEHAEALVGQAFWASAQAIQDFRMPVGPVIRTLWCSRNHCEPASFMSRGLSSPRG